jgi:hypothetical protein
VPIYRERMAVPPSWWFLAGVALVGLAAILTVVPVVGLVAAVVVVAIGLAWALRSYTLTIELDPDGLVAGPARLPISAMGQVEVLDAAAARAVRGRDADPRAYLVLRGYVPTAVRVTVDDQADPTPYWYVSTRAPADLARAIEVARG